jgi:hypothetical protein
MTRRKISKASELFARHHANGHRVEVIAAAYGISTYAVKQALKRAGVIVPRQPNQRGKLAKNKVVRAIGLLLRGYNSNDVRKMLRCSQSYVSNIQKNAMMEGILPPQTTNKPNKKNG